MIIKPLFYLIFLKENYNKFSRFFISYLFLLFYFQVSQDEN